MKIEWKRQNTPFGRGTIPQLPTHRPSLGHPSSDYLPNWNFCFSPHKISSISGREIDKHALLNIYIAPLRELSQTWVDYMYTVPAPPSLIDDICGSVFSCPSTSYPFHFTPVSRWLGGAVVVANLCNAKLWGLQACFNKTQRQGCRMYSYIFGYFIWIFQLTIEKDSGL